MVSFTNHVLVARLSGRGIGWQRVELSLQTRI